MNDHFEEKGKPWNSFDFIYSGMWGIINKLYKLFFLIVSCSFYSLKEHKSLFPTYLKLCLRISTFGSETSPLSECFSS